MVETVLADRLLDDKAELATVITSRMEDRHPDLFVRYGPNGRLRCREDTAFHLEHLSAALDVGDETVFTDYVAWLVRMLGARGIPASDIGLNLDVMGAMLNERYGPAGGPAVAYVEAGRRLLDPSG